MPIVEEFGVEPVPKRLRSAGWSDLVRIVFMMQFSPLQYVLGALAVTTGGLPLWWAAGAIGLGNGLAFAMLGIVAQVGPDYGLSGQVALRATFGHWGARALTSPFRIVAASYLFAAQALSGAFGVQAILGMLIHRHLDLVPIAVTLAFVEVVLAVIGFAALKDFARLVSPLVVVFTGIVIYLYLTTSNPVYRPSRVLSSPHQAYTWIGFASFVTVMWSGALANVTNVADICRYTKGRREVRLAFAVPAALGAFVTAWVGAYSAVATGSENPFVAIAALTTSKVVLVLFLLAIVAQTAAVSIMNLYSIGLCLVNTVPRLARAYATAIAGAVALGLCALPDVIDQAATWITHLGTVAAPLTGVILADYVILKGTAIDVPDLYRPHGRYGYLHGVNPATLGALVIGAALYAVVPDTWLKVVWGVACGGAAYVILAAVQGAIAPRLQVTVGRVGEESATTTEAPPS